MHIIPKFTNLKYSIHTPKARQSPPSPVPKYEAPLRDAAAEYRTKYIIHNSFQKRAVLLVLL